MSEQKSIPTAKEGKPVKLNTIGRGQQIIDRLKQLDFTKPDESTESVVAEFSEQTAKDLIAAWDMQQLHYCQHVASLNNRIVVLVLLPLSWKREIWTRQRAGALNH